ncbi:transcription factor A, mitochondrial [Diprion similis]|uniref:transcription factor A, mitochondrial n=1 Tax=Diprion similis TaxID=362088 RepID=UPI001EF7A6A5|nr:transcription factor A, mitochondrial [Diprion similis]
MAVIGNFFKLCNTMRPYRNLLSSRFILPNYQPVATVKQSLEERLGLSPKPKRPANMFLIFLRQKNSILRQKYPDLKQPQICQMAAQEYKKMDPSEKLKLQEETKNSYIQYIKALESYKNSMTDEQKILIKKAQIDKQAKKSATRHAKDKKSGLQKLKSMGLPKKPASAYLKFLQLHKEKRGSQTLKEWQEIVREKWRTMPDKEKEAFQTEAAESMKEYINSLRLWKQRMEEMGDEESLLLLKKINTRLTQSKQFSK